MKWKIRRIISIALLVCFIASISATAVSASFTLQSSAYQSSDRLKDIAKGYQSRDLVEYTYDTSWDHGVALVQTTLVHLHYLPSYPNQIDGIYGPITANAVVGYQHNHGLKEDGIVGPLTLQKLDLDQKRLERNIYPY